MIGGMAYPARELAADLLAVLDAEGIGSTRVLAAGWSAAAALELAAFAPDRVDSLSLIAPNLPALLLDSPAPEARRYGEALLETIREAADAAARGQTDRALDLYLGVRWGSTWRDRLAKPRLGAIRRAAVNLAPLLNEMAADRVDRARLRGVTRPIMLLLRHDAPVFERWNAEALAALNPRAALRTVTIAYEHEGHDAEAPDWAPPLAHVLGPGPADP
jgi:pimeloyl-ACP methyl ester carboxylesterase